MHLHQNIYYPNKHKLSVLTFGIPSSEIKTVIPVQITAAAQLCRALAFTSWNVFA